MIDSSDIGNEALIDKQADYLISLADVLLLFAEEGRREEFVNRLDEYAHKLEELDVNVSKILLRLQEGELSNIKSQLERLYALHKEVMRIAENLKNSIGGNLEELRKRSEGLRKYTGASDNKEPISLTGVRQG